MQSVRQKRSKWPRTSPQEVNQDRRCRIGCEAEADSREVEANFMQCSPAKSFIRVNRMCPYSKSSQYLRWQCRRILDSTVAEKPNPAVTIAADMAISIGSVPQHRRHHREVEDEVAVEDTTEDDVEEDVVEGDSRIPKVIQRMLL